MGRFDRHRVEDFKTTVVRYLEQLMENQQKVTGLSNVRVSKIWQWNWSYYKLDKNFHTLQLFISLFL